MSDKSDTDHRCPECDREVLNRAHDKCLYCGASIPKELLFTEDEIEKNEEEYKKKMEEAEERRKRNRSSVSHDILGSDYSDGGDF